MDHMFCQTCQINKDHKIAEFLLQFNHLELLHLKLRQFQIPQKLQYKTSHHVEKIKLQNRTCHHVGKIKLLDLYRFQVSTLKRHHVRHQNRKDHEAKKKMMNMTSDQSNYFGQKFSFKVLCLVQNAAVQNAPMKIQSINPKKSYRFFKTLVIPMKWSVQLRQV